MAKVNVSLRDDILGWIDGVRRENHLTRSKFLEFASLVYLEKIKEEKKEHKKQEGIKRACQLQDKIREEVGNWDGLAELARWRNSRK